jgi:hypothetical protein
MKVDNFFKMFIIENYPKFGSTYCKNHLNSDIKKIMSVVSTYRLKRNKIDKINIDTNNKYFCYIIGLIWADGFVDKKTNRVGISLVENDINDIKNIFENVGIWNYNYANNSKRGYKNQIMVRMSDKNFKSFLIENDFLEKSFKSPDKIISIIPKNNLKYFIRGISDGDGCFYYNKKQYIRQFCIASTYDQNWNYIINILNNKNCKFKIEKIKKEKSKSSIIRITNKDILKIGEFLYEDFFGLKRKYEKFLIIKESYNILHHKPKNGARKPIIINGIKYTSLKNASINIGIHITTLSKRIQRGYYKFEFL